MTQPEDVDYRGRSGDSPIRLRLRCAAGWLQRVSLNPITPGERLAVKKLILRVDALRVESLTTSPAMRKQAGTVRAHGYTDQFEYYTCGWLQSCMYVCESDGCPTRAGETCAAC